MKALSLQLFAAFAAVGSYAQVCFTPEPANTYALGNYRGCVKAADMNGDNQPDLIVTNFEDASISILQHVGTQPNGHPQFTETTYPVGSKPWFLYVNDLDGDNDKDIVVTNYHSGTVSVLLNNGGLSFSKTDYAVATGINPMGITAAYLDADGFIDLIVSNTEERSLRVLYGTGNGSFGSVSSPIYTGSRVPTDIITADFNADGYNDVAVAYVEGIGGGYMFFAGNAQGTLAMASQGVFNGLQPIGGISPVLDTADVNNDGLVDLAFNFPEYQNQKIFIMKGNTSPAQFPNSSQTLQVNTSISTSSYNLACADYNGDGNTDIAAILGGNTDSVKVFLGNGLGGFPVSKAFPAHQNSMPRGLAHVDFNGDGKQDLVSANNVFVIPTNTYDFYTWINQTPFFEIIGIRDTCAIAPITTLLTATSPASLAYSWSASGNATTSGNTFNMTATAATNLYTVSGTGGGCTNTSFGVVQIHALPQVAISPALPQSICKGDSVMLSAVGNAASYNWMPGNLSNGQAIAPTSTTFYTVTGYSAFGCVKTDTATIFVNDFPTVSVTVNDNVLMATATPQGATLQWVDCGNGYAEIAGQTQTTFTPNLTGSYGVKVSLNGCDVLSACNAVTIANSSIGETDKSHFMIYPNPSDGNFNIHLNGVWGDISVSVIDVYGRVVEKTHFAGENKILPISLTLAAGIYYLQLEVAGHKSSEKIIIN